MGFEFGPFFEPFLRDRFHKWLIHLKVPFTFDFHLSINIGIWKTNLDLYDPFLGWWCHQGESKLLDFEILYLKFPFTIDFHLSTTIVTWNTGFDLSLTQCGLMESPRESKLQYFERVTSETNSSLQSFIKCWSWSFCNPWYMIYNFGPFFPNWR